MKRQKRDLTSRAYVKGYRAGRSGRSRDICPTEISQTREQWMSGWRQGRADYWDGYQGISGLHCAPTVP